MKSTYGDDFRFRVTLGDIVAGVHDTEKQALAHIAFIAAQGRRAYLAKPDTGHVGHARFAKRQRGAQ